LEESRETGWLVKRQDGHQRGREGRGILVIWGAAVRSGFVAPLACDRHTAGDQRSPLSWGWGWEKAEQGAFLLGVTARLTAGCVVLHLQQRVYLYFALHILNANVAAWKAGGASVVEWRLGRKECQCFFDTFLQFFSFHKSVVPES